MTDSVQDLIASGRHVRTRELAHALNISRHGLYLLIRKGEVKVLKLGNSFRIPASEAKRLMILPPEDRA